MTTATFVPAQTHKAPGDWTYADYLQLPDDGKRYEIIEGVLYVANAPNSDHQFTVAEISRQLGNFVIPRKLGQILFAPFEVHLAERTRPVQPDVLFVRAERWPAHRIAFFDGAPDMVVEVISPSSVRTDRVIKFTAYEQASVAEYWIANPTTRTVEVYTLSNAEYALLGEFAGEDTITSSVLVGIELVVSSLFG
jgi:Uma2 family endonuclease